jgi:hypothetical protein
VEDDGGQGGKMWPFAWNSATVHTDDNPVSVPAEVFGEKVTNHRLLPSHSLI